MTFATWSIRAAGAWGLGMALMAGACSSPTPDHGACGPAHPAFRLVVDAELGYVPSNVRIHVRYGSGEELFDAGDPNAPLKVVFCELERKGGEDGGAADGGSGGPIERVTCELWTDGAATVSVTAQGYPELVRELEAERDEECGIIMTESRITLEHEKEP